MQGCKAGGSAARNGGFLAEHCPRGRVQRRRRRAGPAAAPGAPAYRPRSGRLQRHPGRLRTCGGPRRRQAKPCRYFSPPELFSAGRLARRRRRRRTVCRWRSNRPPAVGCASRAVPGSVRSLQRCRHMLRGCLWTPRSASCASRERACLVVASPCTRAWRARVSRVADAPRRTAPVSAAQAVAACTRSSAVWRLRSASVRRGARAQLAPRAVATLRADPATLQPARGLGVAGLWAHAHGGHVCRHLRARRCGAPARARGSVAFRHAEVCRCPCSGLPAAYSRTARCRFRLLLAF